MKIELQNITVREVSAGYADNSEAGVTGYDDKLDIRPPYQREFIYKDKQRDEVIRTVRKGFPLNTMYWVVRPDAGFELMDGQQRTISLCQYVAGEFSVDFDGMPQYFHGLTTAEQNQILDYPLSVYVCAGSDKEKLDWFKIINIAGEKLTDQELRNAIYTGPWLADAKVWFSKPGAPAAHLADKYVSGTPIRQEFLETALKWICDAQGLTTIEEYMALHQYDDNASQLWLYFQKVIQWVEAVFPHWRKEMKGLDWGALYNAHKDDDLDPTALEAHLAELLEDPEVSNKRGAWRFVLDGDERALSLRSFDERQKREIFERDGGVCQHCGAVIADVSAGQFDHVKPWSRGGKTEVDNGQLLCPDCNARKSDAW
ncbi:MAG: DUF262 domain-containing protein [Coriobacteriia bacterium]|nr:DUF262 domain-containing protein [Coriobacteriia bacterium]